MEEQKVDNFEIIGDKMMEEIEFTLHLLRGSGERRFNVYAPIQK